MASYREGKPGQPGEPGQPGQPGTGPGGGAGGRGGRGGAGGAGASTGYRNMWKRWRGLVGYLLIVGVAVAAVEVHHWQTTKDINDARHQACHDTEIIARNQRLVLNYLLQLNAEQQRAHAKELNAALARVPHAFCK